MPSNNSEFILEVKNITKSFPGVKALDNVNFNLKKGEVHVLLGQNGAGKSTLVKIITGVYKTEEGEIFINGKRVFLSSSRDALKYGISTVFQDFPMVPSLTVAENFLLGQLPTSTLLFGKIKYINWVQLKYKAKESLKRFGIEINPDEKIENLKPSTRQLIAIGKALAANFKILIMDEPTATLSKNEVDKLFEIIKQLKKGGISIIYISHRLDEIKRIGDRATILTDGKISGTVDTATTTLDKIINLMTRRKLKDFFPHKTYIPGKVIMQVKNLYSKNKFEDISFELREGEIIGLTGLIGSGKTELVRSIFGVDILDSGEILINSKKVKINSPLQAIFSGIGLLPEDRHYQGLVMVLNIRENIVLPSLIKFKKNRILGYLKEENVVKEYINKLSISPSDPNKKVQFLSGGNQQKVVFAKWLCSKSKIYIFDEPTIGIDVESKVEIYKLIDNLAATGNGIILISSDVPEIKGMTDRIIIMKNGKIISKLQTHEATEEEIISIMIKEGKNEIK
jgi:ribose transport system ATP-binding protein